MGITYPRNIGSHIKNTAALAPALLSAGAQNGSSIDRWGYASCTLFVKSGAVAGGPTTQTLDAKLQHSPDQSTWADYTPPPPATAVAAIPTITAAASNAKVDVDLSGANRYIRAVVTAGFTGGASPSIGADATITLGGAENEPAQ